MASKKFYSDDDIQLAKAALSELPDLTAQRKTLRDFLDAIRDDIIVLVRTKGYTLADVRKFYSDDDIQLAKAALSELPDLTAQRKTLRDFLDAIRDDIIVLVRTKGYTLADVRDTLKNAGYEVGEKALRDIIREAESKKPSRRSSSKTAPKKTDSGRKDGIDMNNN
ncbi:Uncharacterised protein [Shigella sonnei]|nr:Uncharacterised protein [Shigella sonnei]